jgi:hypothetical protein
MTPGIVEINDARHRRRGAVIPDGARVLCGLNPWQCTPCGSGIALHYNTLEAEHSEAESEAPRNPSNVVHWYRGFA